MTEVKSPGPAFSSIPESRFVTDTPVDSCGRENRESGKQRRNCCSGEQSGGSVLQKIEDRYLINSHPSESLVFLVNIWGAPFSAPFLSTLCAEQLPG